MAAPRPAKRKRDGSVQTYKSQERINSSDDDSEPEEPNAKNVKFTEPDSPKVPDDSSEEEESSDEDLPALRKPSDAEGRGEPANAEGTASTLLGTAGKNHQTKHTATLGGQGGPKVGAIRDNVQDKDEESEDDHQDEVEKDDEEEDDSRMDSEEDTDEDLPDAPTRRDKSRRANGETPEPEAVQVRPAPPYKPPNGFEVVPDAIQSAAARSFESSLTEGKQIWHISAPARVSMSQLEEVSLEQLKKGEAIIHIQGIHWALEQDTSSESRPKGMMVASKDGYKLGISAQIAMFSSIADFRHSQTVIR